jgi:hypothetical protein
MGGREEGRKERALDRCQGGQGLYCAEEPQKKKLTAYTRNRIRKMKQKI